MSIETYFVENGMVNGKSSKYGVEMFQKDGWYYILANEDDGVGPFETFMEAKHASTEALDRQEERLYDEW